jgi:hypothetical protein
LTPGSYIVACFTTTTITIFHLQQQQLSAFDEEEKVGRNVRARVARWFVFKPKIQIWVNFGGPCNGS